MTVQPDAEPPALIPLTDAASAGLAAERRPLTRLPFRVGRDLRSPGRQRLRWFRERRRGGTGPNDVYLAETTSPHRISRQHFLIGFDPETHSFFLEDRASSCGTQVGEARIGGDRRGGRRVLRHGDVIRPGGAHSPFAFRFVLPGRKGGSDGGDRPTPELGAPRDRI